MTRPPTPMETARKLGDEVLDDPYLLMGGCSFNRYVERIAAAIQQAVEAAVEDIAQFVENEQQGHFAEDHVIVSTTHMKIAAAIRARGSERTSPNGAKKEDDDGNL